MGLEAAHPQARRRRQASNGQLSLDSVLPTPPELTRLQRKYRAWKATHPQVYALFLRFAEEALRAGRRFGIKQLGERVRWEVWMAWPKDKAGFRINNNHLAYIGRDLILELPGLADLIETRRVKGENPDDP